MATVEAFNDMMEQFINELVLTFPDEKQFKKFQTTFAVARATSPKQPCKVFINAIKPYSSLIMAKDEKFITELKLDELEDLDLTKIWTPELSTKTKDAIWQYFQTLFIIGTTITSIPDEMLGAIESVAKNFDQTNLSSLVELLGKNPPKI